MRTPVHPIEYEVTRDQQEGPMPKRNASVKAPPVGAEAEGRKLMEPTEKENVGGTTRKVVETPDDVDHGVCLQIILREAVWRFSGPN